MNIDATCPRCGAVFQRTEGAGRPRVWCSSTCRTQASIERKVAHEQGLPVRIELVERNNRDELDHMARVHARELRELRGHLDQARRDIDASNKVLAQAQQETTKIREQLADEQHRNLVLGQELIEVREKNRSYYLDAKRLAEQVRGLEDENARLRGQDVLPLTKLAPLDRNKRKRR